MLDRWTPVRELDRMERRVRRLCDDSGRIAALGPAADVYETDDQFVVELETPGFEEKELAVEVSDHTLVVEGEREEKTEETHRSTPLRERLERTDARWDAELLRHLFFNPLAVVRGSAQTLLARDLEASRQNDLLQAIVASASEIERVVLELAAFAAATGGEPGNVR